MKNLSSIEIGSKVSSTNGNYYHIVQKIGAKKHLGLGDYTVPVSTKCYSNTGRFVSDEKIYFNQNAQGEYIANHIN